MGYNIYIHRREHSYDEGDDISPDEWLAYIATDPSIEIDQELMAMWRKNGSTDIPVLWKDSDLPEGGFYYGDGLIQTKNPSAATIIKAWQIANALDARVEGDNGEFYHSDGSYDAVHVERPKCSLWSRLFGA